jgi:predicted RNase H-like HicB family nuclease
MAIVNRKYGYLFLAEPYCASRAMSAALAEQEGSEVLDTWVHNRFPTLVELGFVKYHEPLFKFSVIRNPADFLVTKYLNLSGWHANGFKAFLRAQLMSDQPLFMHANDVDKTLRYEYLESHLNELLEFLGAPPVTLPVIGKTEDKKYWASYYTPEDLAYIREHIPEFRIYGYI